MTDVGVETLHIEAQQSATAFGSELTVSVIGLTFEGDPLRNRVSFTVNDIKRDLSRTYQKQDVGAVVKVGDFTVLVKAADTFSATFEIRKQPASRSSGLPISKPAPITPVPPKNGGSAQSTSKKSNPPEGTNTDIDQSSQGSNSPNTTVIGNGNRVGPVPWRRGVRLDHKRLAVSVTIAHGKMSPMSKIGYLTVHVVALLGMVVASGGRLALEVPLHGQSNSPNAKSADRNGTSSTPDVQVEENSSGNNSPNSVIVGNGNTITNYGSALGVRSAEQMLGFIASLKNATGSLSVLRAGGDPVVQPIIDQLCKAVAQVPSWGLCISPTLPDYAEPLNEAGLNCFANQNGWLSPPGLALKHALDVAGLNCKYFDSPYVILPGFAYAGAVQPFALTVGMFTIMVGRQPDPAVTLALGNVRERCRQLILDTYSLVQHRRDQETKLFRRDPQTKAPKPPTREQYAEWRRSNDVQFRRSGIPFGGSAVYPRIVDVQAELARHDLRDSDLDRILQQDQQEQVERQQSEQVRQFSGQQRSADQQQIGEAGFGIDLIEIEEIAARLTVLLDKIPQ
jgi:hypothetical protein